jgi:hypothetical protein
MSNFNHNRPYLKGVDNMKREIAEIDSWYRADRNGGVKSLGAMKNQVIFKESMASEMYDTGKKRSVTAIDKKVHVLACSILAHVKLHHEVSLCNKLLGTLSDARKSALVDWFCEFGDIAPRDPNSLKLDIVIYSRKQHVTNLLEAEAKPYWEFSPTIKAKPLILRNEIIKLISSFEEFLAKKIPNEEDNVDLELLARLKNLIKA